MSIPKKYYFLPQDMKVKSTYNLYILGPINITILPANYFEPQHIILFYNFNEQMRNTMIQ